MESMHFREDTFEPEEKKARRVVHPHMTMEGNSEDNIKYISALGGREDERKGLGAGSWELEGREERRQG